MDLFLLKEKKYKLHQIMIDFFRKILIYTSNYLKNDIEENSHISIIFDPLSIQKLHLMSNEFNGRFININPKLKNYSSFFSRCIQLIIETGYLTNDILCLLTNIKFFKINHLVEIENNIDY